MLSISYTYADINIGYTPLEKTPPEGFDNDEWSIKPLNVPNKVKKSFFWANQLRSNNGQLAICTGIQPRLKGGNLVLFSAFGSGTSSLTSSCFSGADGGNGTSCSIIYPWKVGQNYNLKISVSKSKSHPDKQIVTGYIVNVPTKQTTVIGRIETPAFWQGLAGGSLFSEYYPFNSGSKDMTKRECVPYAKFSTSLPYFSNNNSPKKVSSLEKSINVNKVKDRCAIAENTPNNKVEKINRSDYLIELGMLTQ